MATTEQEKDMLVKARIFHDSLMNLDVESGISAIMMLTINYCVNKGLNPMNVSRTIAEVIEEHIDDIREDFK